MLVTKDDFGDTVALDSPITDKSVAELAKVNALRPSMDEFKGKKGYRLETDAKGNVTPHYSFVMNYGDGKGPTREAQEFAESLRAFNKASEHYQGNAQANVSRETLVDAAGNRHQVEPHKARAAARMNGWKPEGRIVGLLARKVNGDFCPRCDRRKSWCECRKHNNEH